MKKTPSKDNNQFGIDCSFPGLCSYCHTEIANFNGSKEVAPGVFRPEIVSLRPSYRESVFELNDGSKIAIPLCEDCDDDIEPQHMAELMESEINGWQKEVDELVDWKDSVKPDGTIYTAEEKKLDYMVEFSAKFIKDRKNKPWTLGQKSKLAKPRKEKLKVKVRNQ